MSFVPYHGHRVVRSKGSCLAPLSLRQGGRLQQLAGKGPAWELEILSGEAERLSVPAAAVRATSLIEKTFSLEWPLSAAAERSSLCPKSGPWSLSCQPLSLCSRGCPPGTPCSPPRVSQPLPLRPFVGFGYLICSCCPPGLYGTIWESSSRRGSRSTDKAVTRADG